MKTLQKLLAISEAQNENIQETIDCSLCFVGFENIKENSKFNCEICDPDPDGAMLYGEVVKYDSLFGRKMFLRKSEHDSGALMVLNTLLYQGDKKQRRKLALKLFRAIPIIVSYFLEAVKSNSYHWIENANLSYGLFDFSPSSYEAYLILKKEIEELITDRINILYLDEIQDYVNEND